VISYLSCPDEEVDLTDPESARWLARRFVLPGILALRAAPADELSPPSTTNLQGGSGT
jgi:hypothetical protein